MEKQRTICIQKSLVEQNYLFEYVIEHESRDFKLQFWNKQLIN